MIAISKAITSGQSQQTQMNQLESKAKTCNPRQARENKRKPSDFWFGFAPDRGSGLVRARCKIFFPIEFYNRKLKQILDYFEQSIETRLQLTL